MSRPVCDVAVEKRMILSVRYETNTAFREVCLELLLECIDSLETFDSPYATTAPQTLPTTIDVPTLSLPVM
jgi:hypothetical protein